MLEAREVEEDFRSKNADEDSTITVDYDGSQFYISSEYSQMD